MYTINLSQIHKPKVIYDLYNSITQLNDTQIPDLPYIITTIPIQFEDGATFGILFIYKLPENECLLMRLFLGVYIQKQFQPYYVKNQKIIKVRQELQPETISNERITSHQPQNDQELQEELDDHFSWDLYAIKHDELSKIENNEFWALIQPINQHFIGINQRKQIKILQFQELLTIPFEFIQNNQNIKNKQQIDVNFMQLTQLLYKYSQYISLTMFNWNFLFDQTLKNEVNLEWSEKSFYTHLFALLFDEINSQIRSQSQSSQQSSAPIHQILETFVAKRFNFTPNSFPSANELIVQFIPTGNATNKLKGNKLNENDFLLRKNSIFCGKFLKVKRSEIFCEIGTFLIFDQIQIRSQTVECDVKQTICKNSGEFYQIQVSKIYKIFQNCPEVKLSRSEYFVKLFIFSQLAADNKMSLLCQNVNLHRIRQQNMKNKLKYQFEFIGKDFNGNWDWKSQIPLFCTFYGGTEILIDQKITNKNQFLLFQIQPQKVVRDVTGYNTTGNIGNRNFSPQSPPLTSFIQIQIKYAIKQMNFPVQYLKDVTNIKCEKHIFYLQNLNYEMYKCKDRLINTYQVLQQIDRTIMKFCYQDLGLNILTKYYYNNYSFVTYGNNQQSGEIYMTQLQNSGILQFQDDNINLKLEYQAQEQNEWKFIRNPLEYQNKQFLVGNKQFIDQSAMQIDNKYYQNCFKVDILNNRYQQNTIINYFDLITDFLLFQADTIWNDESERFKKQIKYILVEIQNQNRDKLNRLMGLYSQRQIKQLYLDLGLQFSGLQVQLE